MSLDTLKELIFKARNLQLEHVEILDKYSITQVESIYNGIGPDRFPAIIRKALNKLHPTLLVVALIHDLEYHEGGTREQFTESNDRFYRNGKTAAFAMEQGAAVPEPLPAFRLGGLDENRRNGRIKHGKSNRTNSGVERRCSEITNDR